MTAERLINASKQLGKAMSALVEEQKRLLSPAAIKLTAVVIEVQNAIKYHMAAEIAQRHRSPARRRKIAKKAVKNR